MKRRIKQVLALLCILLLLAPLTAFAEGTDGALLFPAARVIRVAFPMQGGLSQKDEYGNYSGYTYDYLQEIAQYTGWEYEFVEVPGDINESLSTMLDMLAKGELDIMGGMAQNEYTEDLFGFPEYGYGLSYNTLGALEENTQINETNYQAIKGLRIAVHKSSVNIRAKLEAFCQVNNIDYVLVDCESEAAMFEALKEDRADVMLGSDLTPMAGIRPVAQFNGKQYYFATPKGDTALLSELNRSILMIRQTKPYFDAALYDKYFSNRSYKVYLSQAEQAYVQNAPPLRIAVVKELQPIQTIDDAGNVKGIAADVLELVRDRAGLALEYLPAESYEAAFSMLAENKADAVCGIPYDYSMAQKYGVVMANRFLSAQMVLVSKVGEQEDMNGQTVGFVAGMLGESQPGSSDGVAFASIVECMDAVAQDKIDCAYLNLYSAEYLSHYDRYKELRLVPQNGKTVDFCIGVKKPMDPLLISILNKVTASITTGELETIIYQNTLEPSRQPITLSGFIQENPLFTIAVISSVFLALLLIGALILRLRMQANKRLAVENQRYLLLSELAGEYIYEYDCLKKTMHFSREFCKLFAVPEQIADFEALVEGRLPRKPEQELVCELFGSIDEQTEGESGEQLCLLPGGEQRWLRCTQAHIKNDEGTSIYIIGKFTDVQREKEEKERLERRARVDGLTGLYNPLASKKLIEEQLAAMENPASLLIIDLDNFKEVNDQLGHYMGDKVLKDFAQLLNKNAEPEDIAGRIGGDEFVLYLQSLQSTEALETFCATLCKKAKRNYTNPEGAQRSVSISIGAVLLQNACTFDEVYRAADKELYRAKGEGRDRWAIGEYRAAETN